MIASHVARTQPALQGTGLGLGFSFCVLCFSTNDCPSVPVCIGVVRMALEIFHPSIELVFWLKCKMAKCCEAVPEFLQPCGLNLRIETKPIMPTSRAQGASRLLAVCGLQVLGSGVPN